MPEAPTKTGYIFVGWYTDNGTFRNMFLFGENGDKITQNITLNAQWLEDNPELYRAEYALSEIVIGYAGGDNSKHVTRDLTLQESAGGTAITWTSSNPGVISSAGRVTRPQGSDSDVTLTASISIGNVSRSKAFTVRVIHSHTRQREEIHNSTIADIESMNVSNDELYISYNSDRTQVTGIDGKYSDIVIRNADDALDALYGVRSILGLSDPYEELESSVTTSDNYGGEYSFRQVYNGVRVYGRSVMASANASGEADFLSSSVIASDVLGRADMRVVLTAGQAEQAAVNACAGYDPDGNFAADSERTEQVVYSIGSYDVRPVYAYIVRVFGTNGAGSYVDGSVIVDGSSGEVLDSFSNIHTTSIPVAGVNELGTRVVYDAFVSRDGFLLHDPETKLTVRRLWDTPIVEQDGYRDFDSVSDIVDVINADGMAVSAYTNMQEILKWWRVSFDRDSLNGTGMNVNVYIHAPDGVGLRNNAAWCGENRNGEGRIVIGEFQAPMLHSDAAALDVLAHESTHAVLRYSVGVNLPYRDATGAINEGYADIFGCIKDGDWQLEENTYDGYSCLRNIADPGDNDAYSKGPSKINGEHYFDFKAWYNNIDLHFLFINISSDEFSNTNHDRGVHTNCFIISHAAYLMHEDSDPGNSAKLNWQTLGQVWYRSMRLGNYGAATEFKDVRTAVVRAARKLNLSAEQLAVIKNAFDEVGIEGASGIISGKITDHASGSAVQGASVRADFNSVINVERQTTGAYGDYSMTLEYIRRKYIIRVIAAQYVEFSAMMAVEEGENTVLDIALVRSGTGSGSLIVRSAVDDSTISGVTLNLRRGWNMRPENSQPFRTGDITGENGQFSFENIPAGYYTVEMLKDGYAASYTNITIAPGENSAQTGYLSPTMSDSEYRVVLSWGSNPSDLDSHLEGIHPNGDYAHVYFRYKDGSVNGKAIYLDIDDTSSYGPETVTFEADPESSYEYYVVWYSGSGTWKESEAVINVYNGSRHVAVYTVPEVDNSSGVWSVFRITRGIFTPVNEIVSSAPSF